MTTALRQARRLAIALIGATIIIIGALFLLIPGPGLIIIIVGLAVLASEFVWAESLLQKARGHYDRAKNKVKNRLSNSTEK